MTRRRSIKTNFTAGAIRPDLHTRGDLRAYDDGAARLDNLFILPTGGVTRRPGFKYIDDAAGAGRLFNFTYATHSDYLMVLSDGQLDIYKDDIHLTSITAPWTGPQIDELSMVQSSQYILVVHSDMPPQIIERISDYNWTISQWTFAVADSGRIEIPHYWHGPDGLTIYASGTTGSVTLHASFNFFAAGIIGMRMRIDGREVEITSVTSGIQAQADVIEDLKSISLSPTDDLTLPAWNEFDGWPVSVGLHQGRLVIGGSRDLPEWLWLSKVGDWFNFDLGTGLDDEAIAIPLRADQVNAIQTVVSDRHLQLFTSGAEWMVTGNPVTPSNITVNRQTQIGSPVDRKIQPIVMDGATIFPSRNGQDLREFIYTDIEGAYTAGDLTLLAGHIFTNPVDMAHGPGNRRIYAALSNGDIALLTLSRGQEMAAWTTIATDGDILSVACLGDQLYALIDRANGVTIERLDDHGYLDGMASDTSPTPTTLFGGFDHLAGQSVTVVADGHRIETAIVDTNGQINLNDPASSITAGLPYTHIIEPLPPNAVTQGGIGRAVRLIELLLYMRRSVHLNLDLGRGSTSVELTERPSTPNFTPYDGVYRQRGYGWHIGGTSALWRIADDMPFSFTLLTITSERKVND